MPNRKKSAAVQRQTLRLLLYIITGLTVGLVAALAVFPQAREGLLPSSGVKVMGQALVGGPFTLTDHTGRRVTDKDFRNHLKNKHNIHVAGGQGTMEGQIFRVNHMGYSDAYDALAVVAAVEHAMKALGKPVEFGKGVAATQKVLAELF